MVLFFIEAAKLDSSSRIANQILHMINGVNLPKVPAKPVYTAKTKCSKPFPGV
jgi:hypothetical protein